MEKQTFVIKKKQTTLGDSCINLNNHKIHRKLDWHHQQQEKGDDNARKASEGKKKHKKVLEGDPQQRTCRFPI